MFPLTRVKQEWVKEWIKMNICFGIVLMQIPGSSQLIIIYW